MCSPPSSDKLEQIGFDPIYLSYFVKWNSFSNYYFAKSAGFHDLSAEWKRQNHVEDFDQVESRAYLVHPWMKYPKFGHAAATDYASRMVRYGIITREEAVALVKEHDAIYRALESRNMELVTTEMHTHVANQAVAVKAVIQKQDEEKK